MQAGILWCGAEGAAAASLPTPLSHPSLGHVCITRQDDDDDAGVWMDVWMILSLGLISLLLWLAWPVLISRD